MNEIHPLFDGVDQIGHAHSASIERRRLFERIYEQILTNWMRNREADRWPSASNWMLRVAPNVTKQQTQRLEKQLQKAIAICLENEGWGNDVPTSSGLVNSRGRQVNIDLTHRIPGGFEFIELKLQSNTPRDAALQILRYAAIYMLYRLEPELNRRFRSNQMIGAKEIVLEVLAPISYYPSNDVEIRLLEAELNNQVGNFAAKNCVGLSLSFRFMAFPADFIFVPGMQCELIHHAVLSRSSPFSQPTGAPNQ